MLWIRDLRRDWKAAFVIGFSNLLNNCDIVMKAELLAIKIGIQVTIFMGFRKLVVESDSYTVVHLINNGVHTSHLYHALISSILVLANMADAICYNHVFRETNSAPDGFAKHGLSLSPSSGNDGWFIQMLLQYNGRVHLSLASDGGVVRDWEGAFVTGFSNLLNNCGIVMEASAGGVVRDWKGAFVTGFSNLLNNCDIVMEAFIGGVVRDWKGAFVTGFSNQLNNCDIVMEASAGGVVRDWEGAFVTGFSNLLNNCEIVMEAELLAIKIGIQVTISMGFIKLVVESDSYTVVQLINNGVHTSHFYHALMSSILVIANMADAICYNHVFRKTNSAPRFAKHGLSLSPSSGVQLFSCPPTFSLRSLCANEARVIYSR
ncbi:hypothetical protein VNO78_03016 [Psophocarpus tetragonolobus]|uniref:RNase H type-1 domain-containing protein n=1 Tax=Psophocarpus tetragonolobus TaxID=3891 RepID=A0AAN9TCB9_PSOTE